MTLRPKPSLATWWGTLLLSVLGLWSPPAGVRPAEAQKVIYYGWGVRDTQYVRGNWQAMEELPYDGTGIVVALDRQAWRNGNESTENRLGWQLMGTRAFTVHEFGDAVADLQAVGWRFTDNFLDVCLAGESSAGVDWFDDARWRIIASNMTVIASIAAQAGLKGLILDPEHYRDGLFRFWAQPNRGTRTFADYQAKARQRGREVMAAIQGVLPSPVILTLFGYTVPLREQRVYGYTLPQGTYGLLPAFLEGVLEAMPAGGHLVDAYELSYGFKQRGQFEAAYVDIREHAAAFSGVPGLYRAKIKAGFGLWVDYNRDVGYFTPEEFEHALRHALDVSKGYVWLYSERLGFWLEEPFIKAIAAVRRRVSP